MASGYGRAQDERGGELGAMDDADVADLWVMDAETGAYRMKTPEEVAADNVVTVEPTESPSPADPAPTRRGRRQPPPKNPKGKGKGKRRLKITAISLAVLLVLIVGGAYGYYEYLNSRIKTDDLTASVDKVPEAAEDEFGRTPMNILLIGSDSRIGSGNTGYGANGKEGTADTTLLLHLSADRSNATVVSIPRDTLVTRPACKLDNGEIQPAKQNFAFNATLQKPGGPPCTVATVENMLKVKINHWMMIEFKGVKAMTSAVGGVPITLCDRLYDPKKTGQGTGLDLTAGEHKLQGEKALMFLRARHGFYGESDLARIEAQKSFLMALAREIKTSATWKDPAAIFKIAQAATGNITVDEGLNRIEKLVALGNEIKKVPEKRMAFTTLPVMDVPHENPKVHVQARQPAADNLWASVRNDVAVTKGDPAPAGSAPPSSQAPAPPRIDPATIKVSVRNTTTVPKAQAVVDDLVAEKYAATVDRTKGTEQGASSVVHPKGKADAAKQLAAAVGLPETAVIESATAKQFEVVIGLDFPGLNDKDPTGKAPASSSKAPASPKPPASATPPSSEDMKLNTADNTSCIKTKYSKG
ncbi:LCP family protein [Yinghuangia sp. YIM S09857]|uniref:LCP family protein n=1 Tax=Yinghuangia sp. YIM S09857 TaxID=3436929 RepID=UPI003F53358D